jgi:hypothetical protein
LKKYIVITSIYEPTEAVKLFADTSEFNLIVIGDCKTPKNWHLDNAQFLSLDSQLQLKFNLIKHLPLNHYCRKMIGYLYAMGDADIIVDTDDDNIPKNGWGFPDINADFKSISGSGFVNIYQWYSSQNIWPRGFPLDLIHKKFHNKFGTNTNEKFVGIWQGLADNDPDVDAIYRLTNKEECQFDMAEPLVLQKGVISPFNSQNTLFKKDLFLLMYLPVSVSFRFTDILRGLVAQPIMWSHEYCLGFLGPTVMQKRNEHNLISDLISEIPMYKHCDSIVDLVSSVISKNNTIATNLYKSYEILARHDIVSVDELPALEAWIHDVSKILPHR